MNILKKFLTKAEWKSFWNDDMMSVSIFCTRCIFPVISQILIHITLILIEEIWNVHLIFFIEKEGPVDPDIKLVIKILALFH